MKLIDLKLFAVSTYIIDYDLKSRPKSFQSKIIRCVLPKILDQERAVLLFTKHDGSYHIIEVMDEIIETVSSLG